MIAAGPKGEDKRTRRGKRPGPLILSFHPTPLSPAKSMPTTTKPQASVEALADRVQDALSSSPHLATRGLRIETEHGRVRIAGNVGSFFEKQIAQEVARRVDGVDEVENLLRVNWL